MCLADRLIDTSVVLEAEIAKIRKKVTISRMIVAIIINHTTMQTL